MKKRDIRLTTDAHREAFEAFYAAFSDASHKEGWRASETLRHFLEAAFYAVRGKLLAGEAFAKNEAAYMKIVQLCRHPQETMSNLSVMLGALAQALQAEPVDFIGPVFMEIAADAGMGQCFTPFELCRLMARMAIPDPKEILRNRPYFTIQEPACGVGAMILATNLVFREAGIDVARQVHWLAVDVDSRALYGAYLQAAFTDCSGIFVHGNTLTLEQRSATPTPAAVLYPKLFTTDIRAEPAVLDSPPQLELF